MITCNNDVRSEVWDAKRLIREYVKIEFVLTPKCDGSNLSLSNKVKLQRLASVISAYMDVEYNVDDSVDIVNRLFARGLNNILLSSELSDDDFIEIIKRLRFLADMDYIGVEPRWIKNKDRQSIFYSLLRYRGNVEKLISTFSGLMEASPGGSLAVKAIKSLYNPKLIEANDIIDDVLVDLLGQRFKQSFSISELTEKYGYPSTTDSELIDWEIDNM